MRMKGEKGRTEGRKKKKEDRDPLTKITKQRRKI